MLYRRAILNYGWDWPMDLLQRYCYDLVKWFRDLYNWNQPNCHEYHWGYLSYLVWVLCSYRIDVFGFNNLHRFIIRNRSYSRNRCGELWHHFSNWSGWSRLVSRLHDPNWNLVILIMAWRVAISRNKQWSNKRLWYLEHVTLTERH